MFDLSIQVCFLVINHNFTKNMYNIRLNTYVCKYYLNFNYFLGYIDIRKLHFSTFILLLCKDYKEKKFVCDYGFKILTKYHNKKAYELNYDNLSRF